MYLAKRVNGEEVNKMHGYTFWAKRAHISIPPYMIASIIVIDSFRMTDLHC